MRALLVGAWIVLSATVSWSQLYVDALATGLNDGSSWANAFTTIQHGVDAAHQTPGGAQVWVRAGTYDVGDDPEETSDSFLDMPGNTGAVDILGQENEMKYRTDDPGPPVSRTAHLTVLYLTDSLIVQPPPLDFFEAPDTYLFEDRLERLLSNQASAGYPIMVFANHTSLSGPPTPTHPNDQWISQGALSAAARAGVLHAMELEPYGEGYDCAKWDFVLADMAEGQDQHAGRTLWALRSDDSHGPASAHGLYDGLTMGRIAIGGNRIAAFEQMIRHGNFAILPRTHSFHMPV